MSYLAKQLPAVQRTIFNPVTKDGFTLGLAFDDPGQFPVIDRYMSFELPR
jgi:hypothetical protein